MTFLESKLFMAQNELSLYVTRFSIATFKTFMAGTISHKKAENTSAWFDCMLTAYINSH